MNNEIGQATAMQLSESPGGPKKTSWLRKPVGCLGGSSRHGSSRTEMQSVEDEGPVWQNRRGAESGVERDDLPASSAVAFAARSGLSSLR